MKYIISSLVLSLFYLGTQAQKAEKIYGGARQHKPISYYREQAIAWKKEVDKNPKDPNNWYNYYYVNRNLFYNDTTDVKTWEEKKSFFNKMSEDMAKHIPNTYEYNLCKWMIGGFDMKLLPYLKKATELGEGRTEHLDYLINIAETERKLKDRDLYSLKKFESGQFSGGIVNYNYNVMMGLEKNAILITSGDNDTYPVWLLQAQAIRTDITVVNLSLLFGLDEYRDKLFTELGIKKWQKNEQADGETTSADLERFNRQIIKHITTNTKKYPVYVGLTTACDDKYLKTIKENLYLTGLAYIYSNEPVDNVAFLKRNFEQLYALDYLNNVFYQDLSPQMVKLANGNYIIPMLTLYDHYKLSGDTQKQNWIKSKLMAISAGTEDEEQVKTHLLK